MNKLGFDSPQQAEGNNIHVGQRGLIALNRSAFHLYNISEITWNVRLYYFTSHRRLMANSFFRHKFDTIQLGRYETDY